MSEAQGASETVADPIRVLVADDEETVVDVLRTLIGSDPSLRFVGAAHNAEDAIEMTARERPDVVLLDVRMPGGGGLRATREITKRCAPTKVVALSAHQDPDTVIGMISAGASGYVPKGDPTEDPADDPSRDRSRLRRGGCGTAARAGLADASSAHAAEDRGRSSDPRRGHHGRVRTDRGALHGPRRRPRCASTRGDPPHRSYDTWLADAEGADLLLDFELSAFRASLSALPIIPEDLFLEFEVTQSTAVEGRFRRAIRGSVAPRVVLGFSPLTPAAAPELEAADPGGILATLRAGDPCRGEGRRTRVREPSASLQPLSRPGQAGSDARPESGSDLLEPFGRRRGGRLRRRRGARLIAPGVESEEQLHELRNLGVELVQGPIVGEPIPFSELHLEPGMRDAPRAWITGDGVR